MTKDTTINIRIDAKTKKKAEKIFARCGYTTSQAVRLFLLRVNAEGTLHFDQFFKPNAETIEAFEEDLSKAKRFKSVEEFMQDLNKPDEDEEDPKPVLIKSRKRARH